MQDAEYGLQRIPLLGTWVNKGENGLKAHHDERRGKGEEYGSESERKLRGKGRVRNRGGWREQARDGAGVCTRRGQRGGRRRFGTGQSGNGPHDRGIGGPGACR